MDRWHDLTADNSAFRLGTRGPMWTTSDVVRNLTSLVVCTHCAVFPRSRGWYPGAAQLISWYRWMERQCSRPRESAYSAYTLNDSTALGIASLALNRTAWLLWTQCLTTAVVKQLALSNESSEQRADKGSLAAIKANFFPNPYLHINQIFARISEAWHGCDEDGLPLAKQKNNMASTLTIGLKKKNETL